MPVRRLVWTVARPNQGAGKGYCEPGASAACDRDLTMLYTGALRGHAGVAELVDASGLGPGEATRGGSSPSARTSFGLV